MQLLQGGQVVQQCYSFVSGGYSFQTDSFTNYVVQIDTSVLVSLYPACPFSDTINVPLSALDSLSMGNNFGLSCSSFDYAVLSIYSRRFHPGFTRPVFIDAGNLSYHYYNAICGGSMSGTMTTILSGPIQYAGPASGALTPTLVSGDTLTYTLNNIDSLVPGSLNIMVLTDSTATIGSTVCITGIITLAIPDANINDDTLMQCFTVSNALDPNSKNVYPLDTFQSGQWLTYTVNFQNTGNDTAYTVIIHDTLGPYVDASTFQYVASSAKAVIQLFGNAIMFTFPHINLVDSIANPSLSTGWIQYKVKALSNLPVGTQVENTAYIYFNNNPAVVTNTTKNVVDTLASKQLGIATGEIGAIHIYPNPNNGSFSLQTSNCIGSKYIISDILGHVVAQQPIKSDIQPIYLPEAAEGVYTLLVVNVGQPIRFVIVK